MRHLKAGKILGRTSAHRKALFRNLVTALIRRERIQTTLAKAKELRSKAEKTITLGKKGSLHARRQALGILNEKSTVEKLFGPLAERYATRNGGYTRIIKIGNRRGDDAPMAIIELVDRVEKPHPKKEKGKAKAPAKAEPTEEKDKKVTEEKGKPAKKAESKEKKEGKAPEKREKKTKTKEKKIEKKSQTKTKKSAPIKDKETREKKK